MDPDADWVFGSFRLDPVGRQVWQGTTVVPLRPKLFAALQYFVEHAGRLITREELLRAVWSRTHVGETLLRATMHDLRVALGDDAEAPQFIETIPHQGYRFLAEVKREATLRADAGAPTSPGARPRGLIERDRERAQLDRYLDRTLNRQRQLVFVTGEAGIGKTTLVDAVVELLPNRHGVLVGRGQCVEQYGGSEAYLPVLEAIGQLCRHRAGTRALRILNQYAPTWLVQLPALLSDGELEALLRKTQGAGRDRMLREMAEALEALSVEMPVALVFEDLHWSDHSTLDLLGVLARRRESARLLVLGTYRPADVIVSGHPLRALTQELQTRGLCEEVSLAFLSEPAIGTYLSDRFGVAPDDAAFRSLAQVVHRRTDGNPLFMVNVADDLVARGVLVLRDGAWHVQGDAESMGAGVPDGLKPLVDRQLERLLVEDQRLLEAASVAGRVFSITSVAAALETPVEDVEERCHALDRRTAFIAEGSESGEYAFLHDLYQQALYDRLSMSRRTRLHRRVAEFEAQAPPDQVRGRAAQLAAHFERGGDPDRAIGHLQQAATNALARHAFREATDLLRHALALLETRPPTSARDEVELKLQVLLSTPLLMTKGYAAQEVATATARARELSGLVKQSSAVLPALFQAARLHFVRAELRDADTLTDQLVELARLAPDPNPLVADGFAVYARYAVGDLLTAKLHADRGITAYDIERHGSIALGLGDDPGVMCLGIGAWVMWGLGYPDQARTQGAASVTLARKLEIPYCEGRALAFLCWGELCAGDRQAAALSLDALEAVATRHQFPLLATRALQLRGWLMVRQGQSDMTAAGLLERGLAEQNRTGLQLGVPWFMSVLAEALGAAGQTARARTVIDDAIGLADRTGDLMGHIQSLVVKGTLWAEASDGVAVTCFEEAIAIARRQSAKSMELRAATRLANLRKRQGRFAEARPQLADIYDWFTEGFDTPDVRDAGALLGTTSPAVSERSWPLDIQHTRHQKPRTKRPEAAPRTNSKAKAPN